MIYCTPAFCIRPLPMGTKKMLNFFHDLTWAEEEASKPKKCTPKVELSPSKIKIFYKNIYDFLCFMNNNEKKKTNKKLILHTLKSAFRLCYCLLINTAVTHLLIFSCHFSIIRESDNFL